MLDADLKSKIKKLWDKFWSGGISNPLQAIEQMSYLIFMKNLEDEDIRIFQDTRFTKDRYESIFDGNEDCKWSIWTTYSAEDMLVHVRDRVFPFLRNLGSRNSLYGQYMKDSSFIIPTPSLLTEAVKIIDSLRIKDQNRDTRGDLYEYLLKELQVSGKMGQFRTPRHIIKMMVALADPGFGDRICDPACGTGGFLIYASQYIMKKNTSPRFIKTNGEGHQYNFKADKLNNKEMEVLREKTFFGIDFDVTMVRIALMNLMMHDIRKPNIRQINALSTQYDEPNHYTVVLANPPFKGSLDSSVVSKNFSIRSKKTEILFLELMYYILQSGGRCSVIVPDGVLFGSSKAHKAIRKKLLEDCRLDAIISMPSGVFKPYAGVSTAVLYFTKGEPTKKVWFYDMTADGYSLDDKRNYIDGKGDIPDIIEKFRGRKREKFEDRKAKCFFVPLSEIIENEYDLSINRYKEIEYEEVKYDPPEVIRGEILELEKKIVAALEKLEL